MGRTNEMSNVSRLQAEELIFGKQLYDSGYKTMLKPEQKRGNLLQNIICKFTKPGDLVLDACRGTVAAGQAFLLPKHHLRSVG